MTMSRVIGPPARAELIGQTTQFLDSSSTGSDDLGCHSFRHPKESAAQNASGRRGAAPPAHVPGQRLGAGRPTMEHDVHRACVAGRRSATPAASSAPCPIPVRTGGRENSGPTDRQHAMRPPRRRTTARRACRRPRPEFRPATPRARPGTPTSTGGSHLEPRSGDRFRRSRRRSRARWSSPVRWRSTTARVDRAAVRRDAPTARRSATVPRWRDRRARSSGSEFGRGWS